jgi:hypothetical protein
VTGTPATSSSMAKPAVFLDELSLAAEEEKIRSDRVA